MKTQKYQKGFRKLIAWRQAHELAVLIYKITQNFPKEERYGICDQLRRAASSIGAQLAEGSRMSSMKHRCIYYERAYASAAEVDNFLELSYDLHFLNEQNYDAALNKLNYVSAIVYKLIEQTR